MTRRERRCEPPRTLVRPVAVDPTGATGPTRGQARGSGWRRTTRGLFVPAATPETVEQRILEQSMLLPDVGAVSGWAALRLHGAAFCDGLAEDGRTRLPVPLVVPPGSDLRERRGVVRHRAFLDSAEIEIRAGIPVARAARALLDATCWAKDLEDAVVLTDIALAAGLVSKAEFGEYLVGRAGHRGVARARRALELADERTLSPLETRLRMIWMLDAELPRPRCNWPVADALGHRIGRPDLLCEELAVIGEFDGADHRTAFTQREDVRKEERYRDAGLECFRVVGVDLRDRSLVVRRMRAAVARSYEAQRPRRWLVRQNPGPL